ncbi:MAG: hypothetical protein NWE93_05775 [Candidatus Bathyarchaeota archaeon]|nr:hypothetical protein [Candidatus Bathyarchaeota archaeon]
MKRKTVAGILVLAVVLASTAGALWYEFAAKTYTYPLKLKEQTYNVDVETNWNAAPKVSLSQSDLKHISVDFIGSATQSVFFKITFPNSLLDGNITLAWKYYVQNPDRYTVTNDGTYTTVEMTFTHNAQDEHFEVRGTSAAW